MQTRFTYLTQIIAVVLSNNICLDTDFYGCLPETDYRDSNTSTETKFVLFSHIFVSV